MEPETLRESRSFMWASIITVLLVLNLLKQLRESKIYLLVPHLQTSDSTNLTKVVICSTPYNILWIEQRWSVVLLKILHKNHSHYCILDWGTKGIPKTSNQSNLWPTFKWPPWAFHCDEQTLNVTVIPSKKSFINLCSSFTLNPGTPEPKGHTK
jgi:hypothetical protein